MANVNDTNNTLGKVENQWQLLYEADMDDRDREMIEEFVGSYRKIEDTCEPLTLYTDLSMLRNASLRAAIPLLDMADMGDVRQLFGTLTAPESQGGYGLDPDKLYGYRRALRVFFKWLNNETEYGEYPFWEEIETSSGTRGSVSEEQLLGEDDITKLKEAATNPRDRAFIEFLADTAARISLASQLRVGDIKGLESDRPEFVPNPKGINHKKAPDKRYPLLSSRADLRSYLSNHHIDRRPEAPLWHVLRGYDEEHPEEGAVSGSQLRKRLKKCKQRAGIDKPVNPHNFRHTAITRLKRSGTRDDLIQHIAGWKDPRMLELYDHTTDREMNDQLRVQAGFLDETETDTAPPEPRPCGNCQELVSPTSRFCPRCGAAGSLEAREALQEQKERLFDSAAEARTDDLAEALRAFRQLTETYPELKAALVDD